MQTVAEVPKERLAALGQDGVSSATSCICISCTLLPRYPKMARKYGANYLVICIFGGWLAVVRGFATGVPLYCLCRVHLVAEVVW